MLLYNTVRLGTSKQCRNEEVVRVNINSISNYHYIPPSTLGNCRYLFASTAAEECPLTSTSAGARRRFLVPRYALASSLQAACRQKAKDHTSR
jgi:hypothetical protein